jgi:hypothetical protein
MRAWIGLTDAGTEGAYQWVTGEVFSFGSNTTPGAFPWAPGEPNNQTGDEDYIEMFASSHWNDIPDATGLNQGFLVEYPVDPTAFVDAPVPGVAFGDLISRGFYHPSYPGRLISTVRTFLSADADGTYTITMTAREGAYDGPVIGTATATVGLIGNAAGPVPVDFDFTPVVVAPGTLVTFSMTQLNPVPEGLPDVFYRVGTCDFSASCPTPNPFKETNGTSAPLDTFRRNGVSVIIFDTRPLPPPIR